MSHRLVRLISIVAAMISSGPSVEVSALAASAVQETVVTFDEPGVGLTHGDIVSTQFQSDFGLTISATNLRNPDRFDDLAVIFDTTDGGPGDGNVDPDLVQPFDLGNGIVKVGGTTELRQGSSGGNSLIIQEDTRVKKNGELRNAPDDEGRRPAGYLLFDFDEDISSFGFSLIDIEETEALGGYFAAFFDDGVQLGVSGVTADVDDRVSEDGIGDVSLDNVVRFAEFTTSGGRDNGESGDAVFGNNSFNIIAPLTAADYGLAGGDQLFDTVLLFFNGSGAVDDVRFTRPTSSYPVSTMPEPTWAVMALTGGGCLGLFRRRLLGRK